MYRLMAILLFAAVALAQAPAPLPEARQLTALFGPAFRPQSGAAVLLADLDGDGSEDAVVVATADDPLVDQLRFQYKVIDPYHAAFGLADPKVTMGFNSQEHPRLLLIVHNWRSPRQKFAVVNLPFERVRLARVAVKKKVVPALLAEDLAGARSYLYWDGKRWRWREYSTD
jgi:hypothetical protein